MSSSLRNKTPLPSIQMCQYAWYGDVIKDHPEQWTLHLNADDIAELAQAANTFLSRDVDITQITKANFRLDKLAQKAQLLQHQLVGGLGFMLVKGLDVHAFSHEQLSAIFYGFGAHIGHARMQNAKGHVLGHVRDLNLRSDDPNVRVYQTSERQTFHTDSADVVALLCLNKAKQGGESLLVSAISVFNEMRANSPELLACLMDPIATDRRGEIPAGMEPYFSIPVFNWYVDKLTVIYQRQYIDSAQRFSGAFRLSELHIEALNMFDLLCNSSQLHFRMQLEPGDMQFVYNHSLLHDRTAFVDFDSLKQRRHLLRLWLALPNDRELPPVFKERYDSITVGERGGMALKGVQPCAPLWPD